MTKLKDVTTYAFQGISSAQYRHKYNVSPSSFNYALEKGLIGVYSDTTVLNNGKVSDIRSYVDQAPILKSDLIGRQKFYQGIELTHALSCEEIKQQTSFKGSIPKLKELLSNFSLRFPEALLRFTYYPTESVKFTQLGLDSGYLGDFVDFAQLKINVVESDSDSKVVVRATPEILKGFYPYNLANQVLVDIKSQASFSDDILFHVIVPSILSAMEDLPQVQQEYLELYFLRGETLEEIGTRYGYTRENIRQGIRQAIERLYELRSLYVSDID